MNQRRGDYLPCTPTSEKRSAELILVVLKQHTPSKRGGEDRQEGGEARLSTAGKNGRLASWPKMLGREGSSGSKKSIWRVIPSRPEGEGKCFLKGRAYLRA